MANFLKNYFKIWKWSYFFINCAIGIIFILYLIITFLSSPQSSPSYPEPKAGLESTNVNTILADAFLNSTFILQLERILFWYGIIHIILTSLLSNITAPYIGDYISKGYSKKSYYWILLCIILCFNFLVWGIALISMFLIFAY